MGEYCRHCQCPACEGRRDRQAIKRAFAEDANTQCWSCSCGWIGCYTQAEIAEYGEPSECPKCCRERLSEYDHPEFPPPTGRRAMSGELKPCPFCGGEAHWTPTYFDSDFPGTVDCECGATVIIGGAKAERIAAWNTRAELSSLRGEGEKAQRRYAWAANELLACDYGDNDDPDGRVGWTVSGWRTEGTARSRIYGANIDEAIDAALASIPTPDDKP